MLLGLGDKSKKDADFANPAPSGGAVAGCASSARCARARTSQSSSETSETANTPPSSVATANGGPAARRARAASKSVARSAATTRSPRFSGLLFASDANTFFASFRASSRVSTPLSRNVASETSSDPRTSTATGLAPFRSKRAARRRLLSGVRAYARTPESNLRLAARFDLKGAKPVAVLVRGSDDVSDATFRERGVETREEARKEAKKVLASEAKRRPENRGERVVAADRATLFDAARARRAAGPPFAVATEEGGVFAVSEVSEEDWEVLARAQRALDAHPATAPPLGAGFAKSASFFDLSPSPRSIPGITSFRSRMSS